MKAIEHKIQELLGVLLIVVIEIAGKTANSLLELPGR